MLKNTRMRSGRISGQDFAHDDQIHDKDATIVEDDAEVGQFPADGTASTLDSFTVSPRFTVS